MSNACVIWGQLSLHHQRCQSSQGTLCMPRLLYTPSHATLLFCAFFLQSTVIGDVTQTLLVID